MPLESFARPEPTAADLAKCPDTAELETEEYVFEVPEGCTITLPRDAVLMSRRMAASLTAEAESAKERVDLATRREVEIREIEKRANERILKASVDAERRNAELYKDKVRELSVWYRQPLFVAGITALVIAGTAVGLSQAR